MRRLGSRLMGGKRRRVGKGRFGGGSSSSESTLITLWSFCVVCRRRTRPPSSGTWGRMEVTMCLLLRVTNLKPVFVVRI